MPLDVWKFVLNVTKLRRRIPVLKCESGQPATHQVLADAECESLGTMKRDQTFICKDGVDTKRLLQVTRQDLFNDAKEWGATGLIDESWTCVVYRVRKGTYEARITYEASLAKACKPCPTIPVALKEAKRISGVMTIVECRRNQGNF